jgi:hypothetical protein
LLLTAAKRVQEQGGYDEAVKQARALRSQLQGALPKCRSRRAALQRDLDALAAKLQKQHPTVEAANALDAAKSQVRESILGGRLHLSRALAHAQHCQMHVLLAMRR